MTSFKSGSLWAELLARGRGIKKKFARARRRLFDNATDQGKSAPLSPAKVDRKIDLGLIKPLVAGDYFHIDDDTRRAMLNRVEALTRPPKLSIVIPLYKTRYHLLRACLASIVDQAYTNIEVILVDDCPEHPTEPFAAALIGGDVRFTILRPQSNGGISRATNIGVSAATGDFILFMDHDDELSHDALIIFVEHICGDPSMDVWYSDQVTCNEGGETLHHFHKPDWSPTYMLGVMYLGHLLGVRADICKALPFDTAFDGVQDFEFMLRVSERTPRIGHIEKVLYKWRATAGSLAAGSDEKSGIDVLQQNAVQTHLDRVGLTWRATPSYRHRHRVLLKPGRQTREPRVSIIIPTRDQGEIIERCLDSIFALTDYSDFEVIVVDNRTTDPRAKRAFARHPIKHVIFDRPFNYSEANNVGVGASDGELVLFLNNDTEVLDTDWLSEMTMFFEDKKVGAVGPTLLYPDRRVQHAGIVLGARGTADHVMRFFHEDWGGYSGSLVCARETSGVTAACLMMRRALFDQVGGFSEDFTKHYQDVDMCLKIRDKGLRILCLGHPRLIHYESATRKSEGYDLGDRALLIDRWYDVIQQGDPYFNRSLSLERLDYSLAD